MIWPTNPEWCANPTGGHVYGTRDACLVWGHQVPKPRQFTPDWLGTVDRALAVRPGPLRDAAVALDSAGWDEDGNPWG